MTFGISTWSIHRALAKRDIALVDVPAAMKPRGLTQLQICHFHLRADDQEAIDQLRQSMIENDVTLDALLIDFGDLSHPDKAAGDVQAIEEWVRLAGKLGARYARISAGASTPSDTTMARSAKHLLHLSDVGDLVNVKVITENWHAMMPGPREVKLLHELTRGRIPLCLDFGNWSGPKKYEELEAIAPLAATVHAKCTFTAQDTPDAADFTRCCETLQRANFAGTIALIYDGPSDDEWGHIEIEHALARSVFEK